MRLALSGLALATLSLLALVAVLGWYTLRLEARIDWLAGQIDGPFMEAARRACRSRPIGVRLEDFPPEARIRKVEEEEL